jgi:predicted MFS family arabinose efflux permease
MSAPAPVEPERRSVPADTGGGPEVRRVLATVRLAIFATSLFVRAADPIIPKIADDFVMDAATVALLATAFALPYAIVQPLLGVIADTFGKMRLMTVSVAVIAASGFIGALAPSFSVLLVSRVMTGAIAGGVFPIALAIAGDLVPVHQRQVAVGRLLAAGMLGNLLGSPCAGLVSDLIGWRSVFVVTGCFAAGAFAAALIGFRGIAEGTGRKIDLTAVGAGYRAIFGNPLAKICFSAVLLEGIFLFGLFPYVATLLQAAGETRASIAGIVIAGFALGGVVYSFAIPVMLGRFGERALMRAGGCLMGLGFLVVAARTPWPVEAVTFAVLGLGFYLLHGVIQIYATEIAPAARGSAMAIHSSFYFLGHGIGPVVYRFGLANLGLPVMAAISATILVVVGFVCSAYLRRPRRD